MKFSELTRSLEIGVRSQFGRSDADLTDVCYDSRHVTPGAVFVAIQGMETDGHKYIAQAMTAGAAVIVFEDETAFDATRVEEFKVEAVLVQNSRRALALLSESFFGNPSHKLRMIGVTGTNGKTTVTFVIRQLLESQGEKVGLIGTIGIWIGSKSLPATHTTPESRDISALLAQMVDAGITTCVMEVSSHALALERVAALEYDIAVFTNLSQDHLDFHHSMEEYFGAKYMLFRSLGDTAIAITNADDEYGERMVASSHANIYSYGVLNEENSSPRSDLFATNVQLSMRGTTLEIRKRYSEERATIESSLVGSYNVENILAACSALYFGVPGFNLELLAVAMRNVRPVHGRFETIALPNGATAVVDYAHTPDALERVLETIDDLRSNGSRVIVVFGCGGNRDRTKRQAMGRIAAVHGDEVIITNDNPRNESPESIAQEILVGVDAEHRPQTRVILDRRSAIQSALDSAKQSDIVLIAGKGHENYQIIGKNRRHFDDREEVLRWAQTQQ